MFYATKLYKYIATDKLIRDLHGQSRKSCALTIDFYNPQLPTVRTISFVFTSSEMGPSGTKFKAEMDIDKRVNLRRVWHTIYPDIYT